MMAHAYVTARVMGVRSATNSAIDRRIMDDWLENDTGVDGEDPGFEMRCSGCLVTSATVSSPLPFGAGSDQHVSNQYCIESGRLQEPS